MTPTSPSTDWRLIAFLSLILLNPLPLIFGAPPHAGQSRSAQRHKRALVPIDSDNGINNPSGFIGNTNGYILLPEQEISFAGLLGCKYDITLCNDGEACFDDGLFGQCVSGKESDRTNLVVEANLNLPNSNKLSALEDTFQVLRRFQLDWKDFLTQCILANILTDSHRTITRYRLESLYTDCLSQDEQFDRMVETQEQKNMVRRQYLQSNWLDLSGPPDQFFRNKYFPLYGSIGRISHPESSFGRPWSFSPYLNAVSSKFQQLPTAASSEETIAKSQDSKIAYLDADSDDRIEIGGTETELQRSRPILIEEEAIMEVEPNKLSLLVNEGHPGLLETLQINNNKQRLPLPSQETMVRKNLTSNSMTLTGADGERYFTVETARGYIAINRDFKDQIEGARLLALIAQINAWPPSIFTELNTHRNVLTFHVLDNTNNINASTVANSAVTIQKNIENQLGIRVIDSGIGDPSRGVQLSVEKHNSSKLTIVTLITCAVVLFTMGAISLLFFVKRNGRIRNKLAEITRIKGLATTDYQDLCRQHIQTQPASSKSPDIHTVHHASSGPTTGQAKANSEGSSARSSTSSWSEEPVVPINMDIMTGHLILSYMEDHLRDRHRLEAEWQALCADEVNEERSACLIALSEANLSKNRYSDCIPYDHARIRLSNTGGDGYINASPISDSDPKCKYIATQGPMLSTASAFWQMVWEQGSCVIVALARPIENGITMCHHYWPVEGCERFHDFEVNLVSEHIWSDDYLVRSFYLKNLQTMESRTVTQFHFLTWNELDAPATAKSLLDFRRKVNKCFRGRSSPIIVHCNDGVGRTGTYILLDIVLNRICKGAREINIAATLEFLRDQRAKMVKTKTQFEFTFVAVAEEVTHLLKVLPQ